MNTIFIDFESFYSSKIKYSLKNLSIVEYIKDPRFYAQGMGIKIDSGPTRWISAASLEDSIQAIDWRNSRVVAHNVKFDGGILAWRYGIRPAQYIDTLAMAKAVLGSSIPSASLRDVAAALGLPAKGELKTNGIRELSPEQEAEVETYCIRDVDLCHDIFYTLMNKIPDRQWRLIDWTVRAFLEPQLKIDKAVCEGVYNRIVTSKAALLDKIGIDRKVFASNPQFAGLLEKEGYKVPMKLNKKKENIPALSIQDEKFLEMSKSDDKRLKQLCAARIAVKQTLEETRAKKLATIADISDYCFDITFSGAQQTHRPSGSNGCAGNPQNFGRKSDLRKAIAAKEGQNLIVADLNKIEPRVLAFVSQDPQLMKDVVQEDPYCNFASLIFDREITGQDKDERRIGKEAVLGLGYNMGWKRFIAQVYVKTGIVIEEKFARKVVELYRLNYNGVPKFWKTCDRVLGQLLRGNFHFPDVPFLKLKQNAIVLPDGLEIKYPGLAFEWKKGYYGWRKEWYYEKYGSSKTQRDKVPIYGGKVTENICQALAGTICKEGILRLINGGYPPAGMIHDELLRACQKEETEKVKGLMYKAMTDPMPWWPELPLGVEIQSGRNWKECK